MQPYLFAYHLLSSYEMAHRLCLSIRDSSLQIEEPGSRDPPLIILCHLVFFHLRSDFALEIHLQMQNVTHWAGHPTWKPLAEPDQQIWALSFISQEPAQGTIKPF